jgi:hypothetical protein
MSDLALLVIGFGIFSSCMLATIGLAIGSSQPTDPDVSHSGPEQPE